MRISNLDLSDSEEEILRGLAKQNGHDPDLLTPANLVRASWGFELRSRGGVREKGTASSEPTTYTPAAVLALLQSGTLPSVPFPASGPPTVPAVAAIYFVHAADDLARILSAYNLHGEVV